MTQRKRVPKAKPGDIIEITTPEGLRYAQVAHVHEEYGPLLRAMPGAYPERPAEMDSFLAGEEQFVAFMFLDFALRKDADFELLGNYEIPERCRSFPLFRAGGLPRASGVGRSAYYLWDGEKSTKIGDLPEEYRKLPLKSILSHELFVHWMQIGWKHEDSD